MSVKLTTISLPNGRKQSENGYLKLLVHLLHSHTTDDLQSMPDRAEFNHRFLSLHRVRRREHCSTFLRNIVQNNGSKKQLEIVTQLDILRSAIEDAYRGDFFFKLFAVSVKSSLNKLLICSTRSCSWEDFEETFRRDRKWSLEDLGAFEQLGGLYVLLDLLFLDHRFRILEPEFVTSSKRVMTVPVLKIALQFISQLIEFRNDVKVMFLKSEPLLTLLANNYRYHYDDNDPKWIRKTIANLFRLLAEFKGVPEDVDFGPCGIVTSLTETAVASHTGSDHDELKSSLETILPFMSQSGCRVDFLAVDGSMDMLIDLFYQPKIVIQFFPLDYRFIFGLLLLICIPLGLTIDDSDLSEIHAENHNFNHLLVLRILLIVIFFMEFSFLTWIILLIIWSFRMKKAQKVDRNCKLAGDILVVLAVDLHTNERALERFRLRDGCQILTQFINSRDFYRERYWKAINIFSLMISGHRRQRIGDIEVEKRRLQELNVEQTVRVDLTKYKYYNNWGSHFERIVDFFED